MNEEVPRCRNFEFQNSCNDLQSWKSDKINYDNDRQYKKFLRGVGIVFVASQNPRFSGETGDNYLRRIQIICSQS